MTLRRYFILPARIAVSSGVQAQRLRASRTPGQGTEWRCPHLGHKMPLLNANQAGGRDVINGMIRVPNCSMPMTKWSNVIITPRTPGTAASSSSIRATLA